MPTFRGGPFRAWIEQIYGDAGPTPPFLEVAKRLSGMKNGRVLSLLESFPKETTITGVLTDADVIILEGMHRCAALAMAAAQGKAIATDLTIALGGALPDDAARFAKAIGGHRKGEPPIRG